MRKAFVIFDEEFNAGRNLVEIAKNWEQSGGSVLAFSPRFLATEKKDVLA
ncbi:hypothetical protein CfE428DRAFT_2598 [Chthoniobacter flavus Ellin428]|uniref:Uncharacterized protein n=1 Tax=Chthoniobacter flavus Ellin428 TaxID=497964 RepID=B4D0Z7_9BACT|nr:hypothetical protein CfE428DRAFT_2598 [Chthoniobacter flavus Ellin428]TCO91724.1 hypothetical protein EV701_1075 [Chthoniobacter flavus]